MQRLFIGVLGNSNSGKSTTWNTLLGATVRTGRHARPLRLLYGQCAEVFLVSGSPEERELYVGDILEDQNCQIILCSMQYSEAVRETLNFIKAGEFDVFVQWLNPGYSDRGESFDRLGLVPWLLAHKATLSIRDGRIPPDRRVEEIREFISGWAAPKGLTFSC